MMAGRKVLWLIRRIVGPLPLIGRSLNVSVDRSVRYIDLSVDWSVSLSVGRSVQNYDRATNTPWSVNLLRICEALSNRDILLRVFFSAVRPRSRRLDRWNWWMSIGGELGEKEKSIKGNSRGRKNETNPLKGNFQMIGQQKWIAAVPRDAGWPGGRGRREWDYQFFI